MYPYDENSVQWFSLIFFSQPDGGFVIPTAEERQRTNVFYVLSGSLFLKKLNTAKLGLRVMQ